MKKQLLILRVIWAAMLVGEIMFMFVALFLGQKNTPTVDLNLLQRIVAGMLVVMVPAGYLIRGTVYRGGTRAGVVSPGAYPAGNIVLWAMCEAVAFFGLVVTMLIGKAELAFAISVVAMAIQIVSFPSGGPMGDMREDL